MPDRMLKESICWSDDIDSLTWFEEVVFYRLIVSVDDNGRLDARTAFLKSKLFATDNKVTVKSLEDALATLESKGMIRFYEVEGKKYLYFPKWTKHQKIRYVKNEYPEPPKNTISEVCGNLRKVSETCGKLKKVPAEVEVEVEVEEEVEMINGDDDSLDEDTSLQHDRFVEFWEMYPRKAGKKKAEEKWMKIRMDDDLFNNIMDSLERQKKSKQWTKDGGEFIPHPTTWLNQERWNDELPGAPKTKKAPKTEKTEDQKEIDRLYRELYGDAYES